jgi:hypothetical protein
MRTPRVGAVVLCVGLAVSLIALGCGAGKKDIEAAEGRIKALEQAGIPDTLLSKAKVFLFNAKGAQKTGNSGILRRNYDSLIIVLDIAENWQSNSQADLKPTVDSMRKALDPQLEGLTGLHKEMADSVVGIIDSLLGKQWYRQAKKQLEYAADLLPDLQKSEERAATVRKMIVGTWKSERVPENNKYRATERKTYKFGKDGSYEAREALKGQTQEYVKEDWQFQTWGTWDLIGDTVMLSITRDKCEKKIFWNKNDKGRWEKKVMPTYDSAVTDGSKDLWLTFTYIKDTFKKR